jgi:hypothetical protein
MEAIILEIAACWLGLNAVFFGLLLTRRSRPRVVNALYRWVVGGERPSQRVHSLVWAYHNHR